MTDEYPEAWEDYIGQEAVKKLLRCAAESARKRNEPMDHCLIACPEAGVGKTALAHLIAVELGSKMFKIAETMDTPRARRLIEQMDDFDVLYIDEIHRFKKVTWFHHLLQDGLLTGRHGDLVSAPRITVIGTTTDPFELDETILGRFQYTPTLAPYSLHEAMDIGEVMSRKIFTGDLKGPGQALLRDVASAACHNPRVIKQLLRTVRDLAITDKVRWIEDYGWDLAPALSFRGLHPDGLTDLGVEYLLVLRNMGGQVGHDVLASVLGQRAGLASVERLLLAKGFIERDPSGRILTRAGRDRVRDEGNMAA